MGGQDEDMIPELINCFDRTQKYMRVQVADLSDEEMALQPPGAPNHAAWTLGHVIHSCEAIAGELGIKPWLGDEWDSLFGYGSSAEKVACSGRWSKDALLASVAEANDRLREALLTTDESRLSDPLPDERIREVLPTTGDALLQILCAHAAFHAGQLSAWRRAIGRKPIGVFI